MQRVGFEMKIHPEMVEEYKQRHDDIWPEMSAALVRTGWRNYTIFFKEDGTLFGYVECEDSFEVSLDGMSSCLLYTSPSPRDTERSRMPSSA